MKWWILLTSLLFLIACAIAKETRKVWVKPGSNQEEFYVDSGQCRAQAFAPGISPPQSEFIYNACMQGKGWHQEEWPIR